MKPRFKKQLAKALLGLANNYEIKKRKFLKGIQYFDDCAKWHGHAHDYTAHLLK